MKDEDWSNAASHSTLVDLSNSLNDGNALGFAYENWDTLLQLVKNDALDYLLRMKDQPVSVDPGTPIPLKNKLPESGLGLKNVLNEFKEHWTRHLVGASGPHYLGFVTGGVTPAALAGDWLTSVWDQNTQSVQGQGDVSARMEVVTIDLLKDLLALPETFMGGFVTGATMSNFTCLGTARQWWGRHKGLDIAMEGVKGRIPVLAATAHSSSIKCLSMLGIGSRHLIQVKVSEGDREVMDITDLEIKIRALEGDPFILITSAGTVNTVDFDDFEAIGKLKTKYNFWWHVDGAFGGFAACSPQYKHLVAGWENADSITVDGHKWLNVPYDSGIFFIRKEHHLAAYQTFRNSNAPYLGEVGEEHLLQQMNFLNFLPENSRRFRALPVWFTLMSYGRKGYQNIVENSVRMTRMLSEWIETQPQLKLVAPTRLNNICFTLKDKTLGRVNQFLTELNGEGKVFMSPTVYRGENAIRASLVNWQTGPQDVAFIQEAISRVLINY